MTHLAKPSAELETLIAAVVVVKAATAAVKREVYLMVNREKTKKNERRNKLASEERKEWNGWMDKQYRSAAVEHFIS